MSNRGADMNRRWRVVLTGWLLFCLTAASYLSAAAARDKDSLHKRADGKESASASPASTEMPGALARTAGAMDPAPRTAAGGAARTPSPGTAVVAPDGGSMDAAPSSSLSPE